MRFVIDARRAGPRPSGIGTYARAVGSRLAAVSSRECRFWIAPGAEPIAGGAHVTHHVVRGGTASLGSLLWPARLDVLRPDDVFHATANILGFNLPRRSVLTLHDVLWLEHPSWCQPNPWLLPFSAAYFRVGIQHGLRAAAHIITVSQAAADTIVRSAPQVQARLSVIPLAADPDFRPPESRSESVARAAKLLGFSDPYFLVVGQNQASKGHRYALEAFATALPRRHRLLFVQRLRAGQGIHRDARELGLGERVVFVGPRSRADLVTLLQAASALVQPSLAEGFGLPVLEAMASGCPVVASDIPTLREVLGGAGCLFPVANSGELARALTRVAGEPGLRAELRAHGLERAATFSWDRTAEATLQVYEAVAAR
jgi:glycosyltransferase involved in cell wall biosynthesis